MMNQSKLPEEGVIAKSIEKHTSGIPSDLFLWTALTVMSASLCCKLMKKPHLALFLGQWVAPSLLFGIYNKIVKTEGHDQRDS